MPSPEAPAARPRDAAVHRAEAALLAVVALACLWFQVRLPGKLPADADFTAAAQVLAAEAQPGDVVLLHPWWTEHARLFVPPGLPVVGYQGSDTAPLPHHPRIWVLAQPELPRARWDTFLAAFGPQRTAVGQPRALGPLRLQLFENGKFRAPLLVASQAPDRLSVSFEAPSGERQACTWDGRAHRCPGGYVATEWHETRFEPRLCLRFFPPGGAVKLVAELSGAPAAAGASLEAGFIWDRGAFKDPSYTVTTLGLSVQGGETRTLSLAPGMEEKQTVWLGAVPAGAAVRMTVQSDNPAGREICADFTLWGRP